MCLYPKLIKNRKYLPNKKNKGKPPKAEDERVLWVPIGCTKCMECRKQKARGWQIRLSEHLRTCKPKMKQFVTLTLSTESLKELKDVIDKRAVENVDKETGEIIELTGYEMDNEIITLAVRRFLERWRKDFGTSVTHWLVSELGHGTTEHIHLHGIIFTDQKDKIKEHWQYGYVYTGDYVTDKTVNYIVKYVTKIDVKHKEYKSIILTSPGIGSNYINRIDAGLNKFKQYGETKETYTTRNGARVNLPIYYRNKIYSEHEKEILWCRKLDKNERWVDGSKCKADDEITYYKLLEIARAKNARLGYGDDTVNWERRNYENQRRELIRNKRFEKLANDLKACYL